MIFFLIAVAKYADKVHNHLDDFIKPCLEGEIWHLANSHLSLIQTI